MREYRTVAGRGEAEIIVKKSRFIGQVCPVNSEEEAAAFVAEIKRKHYDAAHNCHAWIIDPLNQRSSDDGEPAGTAGRPILEVLRKENLEQVAVVVTRYFGGVLLGANGLVRAYSQACKAGLEAAGMGRMLPHRKLTVAVDYALYGRLENQIRERELTGPGHCLCRAGDGDPGCAGGGGAGRSSLADRRHQRPGCSDPGAGILQLCPGKMRGNRLRPARFAGKEQV